MMQTPLYVAVEVRPEAVDALWRQDDSNPDFQRFQAMLKRYGLSYTQEEWDADTPEKSRYLYLKAPDMISAEAAVNDLLSLPFLEAAFVKPPDDLPY